MKKAFFIMTLGCVLSLFPIATSFGEERWTGYKRIDKVDVQNGFSIVWIQGNDGCNGLYRLQYSDRYYKEKLNLLMGAFFAGYEVNVKYQDTFVHGSTCEYPIVKVRARK